MGKKKSNRKGQHVSVVYLVHTVVALPPSYVHSLAFKNAPIFALAVALKYLSRPAVDL